jgi:peptidoglycan-associated lipoprotein
MRVARPFLHGRVAVLLTASTFAALSLACSNPPPPAAAPPAPVAAAAEPARVEAAPPADPPEAKGGGLRVDDDIAAMCPAAAQGPKFDTNRHDLVQAFKEALTGLASCLKDGSLKGRSIVLTGHADPRGTDEYNYELGMRRANTVKSALVGLGVEGSRIDARSRGEADAKGVDEATWAEDRRVDVSLAP